MSAPRWLPGIKSSANIADVAKRKHGKRPRRTKAQKKKDRAYLEEALRRLKETGVGLNAALDAYEKLNEREPNFGLCHDIAVGIVLDLNVKGSAGGWLWCCATVNGGLAHSWVEVRGHGIDMDSATGELRIWEAASPPFSIEGRITRRKPAETVAWTEDQAARDARHPGTPHE